MDRGHFERLHAYIATLPVVDCHEHTLLPDSRPVVVDLWTILRNSDVCDDLISAGMPAEWRPDLDWDRAAPYLGAVENTGFWRSLLLAFRELFDFTADELTSENWRSLSQAIQAANLRPDWYAEVLQRRALIDVTLRVQGDEADPYAIDRHFFAPLIKFDDWIVRAGPDTREQMAATTGGTAHKLDDYLDALDSAFQRAHAGGAAGAKSMLAYRRSLDHTQPDRGTVAQLWNRASLSTAETRILEDFMAHEVAARAGRWKLPYQIHVGYGSWQANIVAHANPLLLNGLIDAHPRTTFVLLHGGYPFVGELGTLAKNHPNVYLECGWLAYIAPVAYRRALSEWLDSVPATKLLAFSADCLHIEQTFGALILTRRLLAQVLADKIEDGWSTRLAESVAARLLHGSAAELYRLDLAQ
jgi:hypothetical protein